MARHHRERTMALNTKMLLVALLIMYMCGANSINPSKISVAEQRAILEGPKLLDEIVPCVHESFDSPTELVLCMQVSKLWYRSARANLLNLCGRLGPEGQILPDFSKILESPSNLGLLSRPYQTKLHDLSKLIRDMRSEFTKSDAIRTWASEIVSAVPYMLETHKCAAFTGMAMELIDVGGFEDVIQKLIPFRDDVFWDPEKLAWQALFKGQSRNLVLQLSEGADENTLRVIQLASSHRHGLLPREDFLAEVKQLISVPLHFLVYLCKSGAESTVHDMLEAQINLTGNPADCKLLKNLYDCGSVGLEIARYSIKFPELKLLPTVLFAHEAPNIFSNEASSLPVLAYMAFGSGPFGKAVLSSVNDTYGWFAQTTGFIGGTDTLAVENLYSYLSGSHGISPEYIEHLMEAISLVPFKNHLRRDIDMNMQNFCALLEHPVLNRSQKKFILEKYFSNFPKDAESAFKYLESKKEMSNCDIGYCHTFDSIVRSAETMFETLKSTWKFLFDKNDTVEYINSSMRSLEKIYPEHIHEFKAQCKKHVEDYIFRRISLQERSFIRHCILWLDLDVRNLLDGLIRPDHEIFLGFVNTDLDPTEKIIMKIAQNFPSLYKTVCYLIDADLPSKFIEPLKSNITADKVRDLVLFAVHSNAPENIIIKLLKLKINLSTEAKCLICSALIRAAYPEAILRSIFGTISYPAISRDALDVAKTNEWYSEEFVHLLLTITT